MKFNNSDLKVYNYLKENKKQNIDIILKEIDILDSYIRRSIEYLKANDVIKEEIINKDKFVLTDIGKKSLENGLIEDIFCKYIEKNEVLVNDLKNIKINELKDFEVPLAFGICKKEGLVVISDSYIKVNFEYRKILNKKYENLKKIQENQELDKEILNNFLKRKLILKKIDTIKNYIFLKEVDYTLETNKQINVTSDIIKNQKYKQLDFKEYDVTKLPKKAEIGKKHPLREIIYFIKEVYSNMGFKEMQSPYVDLSFWSMDAMFIAQDHPMRDIQDTFFLNEYGNLDYNKQFLEDIKEIHKSGKDTGSIGHKYDWDSKKAAQLILRTHTTAATFRNFYKHRENIHNQKYFSVGRVFRNESIDSSHLPEFHQAEGFVVGEKLGLADLMGFIKQFVKELGIEKIKFKPTYNPYTEPSVEGFVYFEKEKKWLELINAGIFRAETLSAYGIKQNVIAWGLGVERLAMIKYQKSIKEILGDEINIDWIRNHKIPKKEF